MGSGFGPVGQVYLLDGDDRVTVSEWWTSSDHGVGIQLGKDQETVALSRTQTTRLAELLIAAAGEPVGRAEFTEGPLAGQRFYLLPVPVEAGPMGSLRHPGPCSADCDCPPF